MIKLKLEFGLGGAIKSLEYYGDIENFHQILSVDEVKYLKMNYRPDLKGHYDYIVLYEAMGPNHPKFSDPCVEYNSLVLGSWIAKCECGAVYDRDFPGMHLFMCPMWVP